MTLSLIAVTNIETFTEKESGVAMFDWRPGRVIKMTTPNLNYYFYK